MTTLLGSLTELPTAVVVLLKMTLLLGAGWMLHFALFRRNPRWRVLVWRGVMAGMILLPLGELLLPKLQIAVAPPPVVGEPGAQAVPYEPVTAVQSDAYVAPPALGPVTDARQPSAIVVWAKQHPSFLLLTGWGLIGLILAVRVICDTHRVRRVVRTSEPAPERIRGLMEKVAEDLQCNARVSLRVTPGLGSPFLAGVMRPVLVLPERMTDERHAGELPAVFAHELAHLHAHDLIWIVAGKWLAVLWWFHPLAWTARVAYIGACEEVCDAVAADYVGGAPSYSRTLARAALELVVDAPAPGGIPMIRGSDITRRLRNLKRGIKTAALARPCVVVAVVSGCVALLGLGRVALVRGEQTKLSETEPTSEYSRNAAEERTIHSRNVIPGRPLPEIVVDARAAEASVKPPDATASSREVEEIIRQLEDSLAHSLLERPRISFRYTLSSGTNYDYRDNTTAGSFEERDEWWYHRNGERFDFGSTGLRDSPEGQASSRRKWVISDGFEVHYAYGVDAGYPVEPPRAAFCRFLPADKENFTRSVRAGTVGQP